MTDQQEREPVGSLAEEAAKLVGAMQGWAKNSGSEYAHARAGAATGAASVLDSINEHIATEVSECRFCPICQVVFTIRETSPEVRQHLTAAASSLLQAASELLAAHASDHGRRGATSGVEKIDLSDGDEWEED